MSSEVLCQTGSFALRLRIQQCRIMWKLHTGYQYHIHGQKRIASGNTTFLRITPLQTLTIRKGILPTSPGRNALRTSLALKLFYSK